jgi:diguanylate cyclase (GGDEF)-like protein
MSKEFKYIFLIKKDPKNHYRFLLDGDTEDPVEFNSIFFPKNKKYDEVYTTQQAQIIEHSEGVEEVWLSLLYPVVNNNDTEALLVIDLSKIYGKKLSSFNNPMQDIVFYMQLFLALSSIFLLATFFNFYVLKKSLLEDGLTSAKTKMYLREFFEVKHESDYNFILIDIDNFRVVNEKYGVMAGDTILQEFVREMEYRLDNASVVTRLNGAEFMLAIPKEKGDIETVAKILFRQLSEKNYLLHNDAFSLKISMSAIDTPAGIKSLMEIESILEHSMLEIKSSGKNRYIVINQNVENELRYKNMDYISQRLDKEDLLCLYQPIYDIETDRFVKFEALVRLIDKEKNRLISPNYFVDTIRSTYRYIKMSRLVFKEVFTVLNQYEDVHVSLNLDLFDLYNEELMDFINLELYNNRKVANRLTFEILEKHEIRDFAHVSLIFQKLKTYGSKIAIDDFGSGHSNYIYLIKLDIDILKLDGSLINALKEDPERAKVVLSSICALAKKQGYEVIAEFISDKELYEEVKKLGIRYVQGYYLGKPKPIEEYYAEDKEHKALSS